LISLAFVSVSLKDASWSLLKKGVSEVLTSVSKFIACLIWLFVLSCFGVSYLDAGTIYDDAGLHERILWAVVGMPEGNTASMAQRLHLNFKSSSFQGPNARSQRFWRKSSFENCWISTLTWLITASFFSLSFATFASCFMTIFLIFAKLSSFCIYPI